MSWHTEHQEPPSVGDLAAEGARIAAGIVAIVAPFKPEHRSVAMKIIAGEVVRRLVQEEPACGILIAARAMVALEERGAPRQG